MPPQFQNQPSDLLNPVPGSTPSAPVQMASAAANGKDYFGDLSDSAPSQAPTPSAAPSPYFGDLSDTNLEESDQPSIGNLPGGLFGKHGNETSVQQLKDEAVVSAKNFRDLGINFLSTMTKDKDSALALWKKSVGPENAKINADGEVAIRWSKDEPFRPVNKKMFQGIANFISNHGRATAFTAAAMALGPVADAAAPLLGAAEVAPAGELVSGAVEAAPSLMARMGAAVSKEAMTKAAVTGGGGLAAADLAGSGIQNAAGDPNAPGLGASLASAAKSAPEGAVGNMIGQAVLGPTMALGEQAAQNVGTFFSGANHEAMVSNLKSAIQSAGLKLPESSYSLGTALGGKEFPAMDAALARASNKVSPLAESATANESKGAFKDLQIEASKKVGTYLDQADAAARAKDQKFSVAEYLKSLRTKMEGEGIKFSQRTVDHFDPEAVDVMPYSEAPKHEINFDEFEKMSSRGSSEDLAPRKITTDLAFSPKGVRPFGENQSGGSVQFLINHYNDLATKEAAGGLFPRELSNFKQNIADAAYDQDLNPGERSQAFMQQATGILAGAERGAVKEAIGDPAIGKQVDQVYQDYASKIGPLAKFVHQFKSSGSAENFVDNAIQSNNTDSVRQLKYLLDAPETQDLWKQVKGNWFSNQIIKHSSEDGLDAKTLSAELFGGISSNGDKLKGYSPEILDTLFPKGAKDQMKMALNTFDKLQGVKFSGSNTQKSLLNQAIGIVYPMGGRSYHGLKAANMIFSALKKNGPEADYLANEGFFEIAKQEARSPADRQAMLEAAEAMKQHLAGMKRIYAPKVGYRYVTPAVGSAIDTLYRSNQDDKAKLGDLYEP